MLSKISSSPKVMDGKIWKLDPKKIFIKIYSSVLETILLIGD
jgi:hypothetical protein